MRTETRYARSGDAHVAYQVVGSGPLDVIVVPDWISHVEIAWELPAIAHTFERLASFSRLILFDKRGTGLSDPVPAAGTALLEQWMDDACTVLDAVGSAQAAVLSTGYGGTMSILLAATFPQRVARLVLVNTFPRPARAPDYPPGMPAHVQASVLEQIRGGWGTGVHAALAVETPSPAFRDWYARFERLSMSPGTAIALLRTFFGSDVRPLLPALRVPTLVLQRAGDRWARVEHGRWLAAHIPGAHYIEAPGADHWFAGADDPFLDEIEEFLTGVRQGAGAGGELATVLFTDIVGSTRHAVALGPERWRQALDEHDQIVRQQLTRFRGREVKTTGDGFVATFDGPARAVRCACAVRDAVRRCGLEMRAGLHTGEVLRREDDIGGVAVHLVARVVEHAAPGEVLVTRTLKDLVAGAGIAFADRGTHAFAGIPDAWQVFAVA